MRYRPRKRADRRRFIKTADRTKFINIRPMIMRGGFRL